MKEDKKNRIEAVFIDRDGTLSDIPELENPAEIKPFEFVPEIIRAIKQKGIRVFIFTNQACVSSNKAAAGYDFAAEFKAYGADDWFICPHYEDEKCECRKPKIGLLLRAKEKYGLDLKNCIVVGDRITDMISGINAGTRVALVLTGEGKKSLKSAEFQRFRDTITVIKNLTEILDFLVDIILKCTEKCDR